MEVKTTRMVPDPILVELQSVKDAEGGSITTINTRLCNPRYEITTKVSPGRREKPEEPIWNPTDIGNFSESFRASEGSYTAWRHYKYKDYILGGQPPDYVFDFDGKEELTIPYAWLSARLAPETATALPVGADDTGEYPQYRTEEAIESWLDQVKDLGMNLAMLLAEFKETQDMLVKGITGFVKFMRTTYKASRGDPKALKEVYRAYTGAPLKGGGKARTMGDVAKHLRDTTAGAWMMNTYGIQPFVGEVQAAAESLARAVTQDKHLVRLVKGRNKRSESNGTAEHVYPYGDDDPLRVKIVRTSLRRARMSGWVDYTFHHESLGREMGVNSTLSSFMALGLELVPCSFVLGWFVDLGGYLGRLDALHPNYVNRYVATLQLQGTDEIVSTTHVLSHTEYRRIVYPVVEPPMPRYEPSLGVSRIASALALAVQLPFYKRK